MKIARQHDDASRSAFTLVEILIVLCLLGLGLVLAIPKPKDSFFKFEKSIAAIRNGLMATRALAIKTNEDAVFALDLGRRFYGSQAIDTTNLPDDFVIGAEVSEGERVDDTRAAIRFFPSGRSSGGAIILEHIGKRVRIEVNWLTGYASIKR